MEKQRAPYLKNLKRESDVEKFIHRRNERSISTEESIAERLSSQICFDISFQALIEEAAKKIDEQEKKISELTEILGAIRSVDIEYFKSTKKFVMPFQLREKVARVLNAQEATT